MNKEIEVFIEICRDGAELPKYAKQGDAGMDVKAAEEVLIAPMQTVIIPTGLKMAIPVGYEIQVRPRSGTSSKTPLRVSNSPGTIDSGYRDEVGVIITNTSVCNEGEEFNLETKGNRQGYYRIKKGERIAQLVLNEVPKAKLIVVDSIKEIGDNRHGGFGSTGVM